MTSPAATVGFVGLGHMGAPMTRRLAEAGVAVRGYDINADARTALTDLPLATAVDCVTDAARGADMVILMLPDSAAVEKVILDAGLLAAVRPQTLLIDMSSSEPTATRALAEQATKSGRILIDAPVSGGVRGAETGQLTIMVGGPEPVVRRARPVLEILGSRIVHAGPVGAGHAIKALNNLMSAIHLLGTSEAMLIGRAFGLDPTVMLDIVNGSTGRSWSTQTKWPDFVLNRSYASGFGLNLMVKDMRTALTLANRTGTPAHLSAAAVDLWTQAARTLSADADHTEIVRWLETVDVP